MSVQSVRSSRRVNSLTSEFFLEKDPYLILLLLFEVQNYKETKLDETLLNGLCIGLTQNNSITLRGLKQGFKIQYDAIDNEDKKKITTFFYDLVDIFDDRDKMLIKIEENMSEYLFEMFLYIKNIENSITFDYLNEIDYTMAKRSFDGYLQTLKEEIMSILSLNIGVRKSVRTNETKFDNNDLILMLTKMMILKYIDEKNKEEIFKAFFIDIDEFYKKQKIYYKLLILKQNNLNIYRNILSLIVIHNKLDFLTDLFSLNSSHIDRYDINSLKFILLNFVGYLKGCEGCGFNDKDMLVVRELSNDIETLLKISAGLGIDDGIPRTHDIKELQGKIATKLKEINYIHLFTVVSIKNMKDEIQQQFIIYFFNLFTKHIQKYVIRDKFPTASFDKFSEYIIDRGSNYALLTQEFQKTKVPEFINFIIEFINYLYYNVVDDVDKKDDYVYHFIAISVIKRSYNPRLIATYKI